jgi:hypothetical protein
LVDRQRGRQEVALTVITYKGYLDTRGGEDRVEPLGPIHSSADLRGTLLALTDIIYKGWAGCRRRVDRVDLLTPIQIQRNFGKQ